uniref:Uncharacterized protein n=1 Tax=Ditylenchus dipsaci TaxID=166011 RepID=A0A915DC80_9BILA
MIHSAIRPYIACKRIAMVQSAHFILDFGLNFHKMSKKELLERRKASWKLKKATNRQDLCRFFVKTLTGKTIKLEVEASDLLKM